MLAEGAQIAVDLADEIDAAVGEKQVTILDIGGGLPVNFDTEETSPTWELRRRAEDGEQEADGCEGP